MKGYHTYLIWLSTIVAIALCGLLATAFYLAPLSGDLSRLGGYSENQFGWREPQQRFDKPLYQRDVYDRYYDVVVFGDSFSYKSPGEQTDVGSYWPNFFVNRTGLSLVSFHHGHSSLKEIIDSKAFQLSPPRLFIYEVVERDLIYVPRYDGDGTAAIGCEPGTIPVRPSLKYASNQLQPLAFARPEVYRPGEGGVFGLDLVTTANFIQKNVLRSLLGIDNTKVLKFDLTRPGLFSSRVSTELLVYGRDVLKKSWHEKQIKETRCALVALQNLVQANGQTHFMLMIAPDKLTAYGDYLADSHYGGLSKIEEIGMAGLHAPRLDQRIKQKIAAGVIDMYLPNDSHWGVNGHELAADVVVDYLVAAGQLQRSSSEQDLD